MISLFLSMGFYACITPQPTPSLTASDIAWKDGNVAIALAQLEAKAILGSEEGEQKPDDLSEELKILRRDLELVQEQLDRVLDEVHSVQENGVGRAELVPYDPRTTTLEAKTVQTAIDEMMERVKILERNVLDDLGQPGPGLFEIPKDKKKGNGPGQQGAQGQQGPPGPPPNGGGPGGPQQGQQGGGQAPSPGMRR